MMHNQLCEAYLKSHECFEFLCSLVRRKEFWTRRNWHDNWNLALFHFFVSIVTAKLRVRSSLILSLF